MKPTHQYTNNYGHTSLGVIIANGPWNMVWFLALCDDGETWMKEPICLSGAIPINNP